MNIGKCNDYGVKIEKSIARDVFHVHSIVHIIIGVSSYHQIIKVFPA